MTRKCKNSLNFLFALWLTPYLLADVQAQIVTRGNLFEIQDIFGGDLGSTVDHWGFTLNSDGFIGIDLLSWEVEYDELSGFFTNVADVNGDGEIAFVDPYIYLFADDGSLDVFDLIADNDDSGDTFGDGSIYALDSYLGLFLPAGDYILAVGAYFLGTDEAVAGVNDEIFYPTTFDELLGFLEIDHGDYQITWTGDIAITSNPGTCVPEPTSVFLALSVVALGLPLGRRSLLR